MLQAVAILGNSGQSEVCLLSVCPRRMSTLGLVTLALGYAGHWVDEQHVKWGTGKPSPSKSTPPVSCHASGYPQAVAPTPSLRFLALSGAPSAPLHVP